MKKDILFIIPSLGAGGGEKSLINLLTVIDYEKYNVDLFLLNKDGLFMEFLPKEVRVLEISNDVKIFKEHMSKSTIKFLLKGKFKLAYSRLMFTLKNRIEKNPGKAEQSSWKYFKNAIGIIDKKYDVAIGYLEKTSNYICVDCVQANKKIGWVHNDYRKLNLDKEFDNKYFNELDYLETVSEECENVLKQEFPEFKSKIKLMFNIVSKQMVEKLAEEPIDNGELNKNKINILSIGRLHKQKGFDIAIEACRLLVHEGYNICWSIIGEGEERHNLEKLINKYGLENSFRLLGLKSNPYKYLKACDIYAQPSRYEGKSVAIDEAMILNKPILVTNFSTVYDQINNGHTGIIVELKVDEISKGIKLLLNKNVRDRLINTLEYFDKGNESEILKLYEII